MSDAPTTDDESTRDGQAAPEQERFPSEGASRLAPPRWDRRGFLKSAAAGTLGVALAGCATSGASSPKTRAGKTPAEFRSRWPDGAERVWIGPDYWANPLQDWRLAERGRVELVGGGETERNVQLLTHRAGERPGRLVLRAHLGFYDQPGQGHAGFGLGVQGPIDDYRSDAVYGEGLSAGLTSTGRLFIGDEKGEAKSALARPAGREPGLILEAAAAPDEGANGRYTLTLRARDPETDEVLGQMQRAGLAAEQVTGNVALVAAFADAEEAGGDWGDPRVWFGSWAARGEKIEAHPERAFGPILFSSYTLSRGTMRMTAQLAPVGAAEGEKVRLQTKRDGSKEWETISTASVDPLSRTATFEVPSWDDVRDVPYRLAYRYRTAKGREPHYYEGTVRRDPKDEDELVVGGLSCRFVTAFPHTRVAEGVRAHDPDLLAFTGDQYYEVAGGYGARRTQDDLERNTLDALRKWILHGWSFGDLARNRPTIYLPDDHDVWHGNLWGEGGKHVTRAELHDNGGYLMPPEWVNAVQRMQTAHLPTPPDPTPVKNDIGVYYTDLVYGRVSFAILEDRKWKSGPDGGLVPVPPGRPDHVKDPDYDPSALDTPAAELLGPRQLKFLDEWTADWQGADMKTVVSQTVFAQTPTHHGGNYMYLAADLDANGWPKTPRDEAVRHLRKGLAFHLGGDQHLPMILRYGVEDFDDGGYSFCVPAISNVYPRAFWPSEVPPELQSRFEGEAEGPSATTAGPGPTGRYTDGFGNKMTVRAVANPAKEYREAPREELMDKSAGYGIARFHKPTREITMEAWPILSDPRGGEDEQYAGWPQTVPMAANDGRAAAAYLPPLEVEGATAPVVQVRSEDSGETLYTRRIRGQRFRPKVFREDGTYTVRVSASGARWQETVEGVQVAGVDERATLPVTL